MAIMVAQQLETMGLPMLDHFIEMDLDQPDRCLEQMQAAFAALEPGITIFLIHPAVDTPELREITPDWRARVAHYETFLREDLREYVQSQGIQVIGYRKLQELMPEPETFAGLPI
jgi:hypothetical protein